MSKLIKCDRCGKIDDELNPVSCGTEEFFTGRIEHYQYSDVPKFIRVDLCQSCNAELNANIRDFMAKAQSTPHGARRKNETWNDVIDRRNKEVSCPRQ